MTNILSLIIKHPSGKKSTMQIDLDNCEHITFGIDKNLNVVLHTTKHLFLWGNSVEVVTSLSQIASQIERARAGKGE